MPVSLRTHGCLVWPMVALRSPLIPSARRPTPERRRRVRYRLRSPDGDDIGEATYAMMIKRGEEIIAGSNERVRVVVVVLFDEEDESPFVGCYRSRRRSARAATPVGGGVAARSRCVGEPRRGERDSVDVPAAR